MFRNLLIDFEHKIFLRILEFAWLTVHQFIITFCCGLNNLKYKNQSMCFLITDNVTIIRIRVNIKTIKLNSCCQTPFQGVYHRKFIQKYSKNRIKFTFKKFPDRCFWTFFLWYLSFLLADFGCEIAFCQLSITWLKFGFEILKIS